MIKRIFLAVVVQVTCLTPPVHSLDLMLSGEDTVTVIDGDTIKIINNGRNLARVRLAGIDAPELSQDYGQQAKMALIDIVKNKEIVVTTFTKDRFGRYIGILSSRGIDLNNVMVESGNAWVYKKYVTNLSKKLASKYLESEMTARRKKIGLWRRSDPVAPWLYRKQKQR